MKIETPILRRLGPVPFWRGERKCLDQLEEIYRKAMEAAARLRRSCAVVALAASLSLSLRAGDLWKGTGEDAWYSGPRLSEMALNGKVVMLFRWDVGSEACRHALPRMRELWQAFRRKPFVLVASHRRGARGDAGVKAVVEEFGLEFPVYQGLGLAEGEPSLGEMPSYVVVSHQGKVVYSGSDDREATEAMVTAIGDVGRMPDLLAGVTLKHYRSMRTQLVFGKAVGSNLKKLRADVKYLSKGRSPIQAEQRREAEAILKAIEAAADEADAEIASLLRYDEAKALKMIRDYCRTYPERGEEKYAATRNRLQSGGRAVSAR